MNNNDDDVDKKKTAKPQAESNSWDEDVARKNAFERGKSVLERFSKSRYALSTKSLSLSSSQHSNREHQQQSHVRKNSSDSLASLPRVRSLPSLSEAVDMDSSSHSAEGRSNATSNATGGLETIYSSRSLLASSDSNLKAQNIFNASSNANNRVSTMDFPINSFARTAHSSAAFSSISSDNSKRDSKISVGGGYGSVGVQNKKNGLESLGFGLTEPTQSLTLPAGILLKKDDPSRVHRRYGVGNKVLICNHQSRWGNLVNKYGFPDREGLTPEERSGPYVYVLATVTKVHFEEDAQYYTVRRADTNLEQRADAEWMEPILNKRAEAAALKAAQETNNDPNADDGENTSQTPKSGFSRCLSFFTTEGEPWYMQIFLCILKPIFFLFYILKSTVGRGIRKCSVKLYHFLKKEAMLLLNGRKPYYCSIKLTGVNLLVLCSIWYTLIDQFRLAFVSASADKSMAIVSAVVWFILVLELIFEVFIRPDGYKNLIISEKAYEPSTVRNINRFHVIVESISLVFFFPEIFCLFSQSSCGDRHTFSLLNASILAVTGPTGADAFFGHAFFAVIRFRIFGLVRHWKQMWINNTYVNAKRKGRLSFLIPSGRGGRKVHIKSGAVRTAFGDDATLETERQIDVSSTKNAGVKDRLSSHDRDDHLTNVTTIGTALMVVNSHRALIIIGAILGLFPLLRTIGANGNTNTVAKKLVSQLQGTNLIANSSDIEYCKYLQDSVFSWLLGLEFADTGNNVNGTDIPFVLFLQILPVRCGFQGNNGVVTQVFCDNFGEIDTFETFCSVWGTSNESSSIVALAERAGVRTGEVITWTNSEISSIGINGTISEELFNTTAMIQESFTVQKANTYSFILQLLLILFTLFGLSVLRADAARLVLGPLRRMLKIVSLYAKNPLSPAPTSKKGKKGNKVDFEDNSLLNAGSDSDDDTSSKEDKLGNFETEQLISAITKITDLLRKCWGVAGAGIVSANLAREEDGQTAVFNPCVPGKSVYALFAFCGIKGFDHQLRALQGEIMDLINDVASVLHKEVYRWGFGDSGQCNKNLGANFLMVFRIGDVGEVKAKRDRARDVIFDPRRATKGKATVYRRKHGVKTIGAGGNTSVFSARSTVVAAKPKEVSNKQDPKDSLSLASLPGISTFTDRAVIGMLKTYAGIYRDQKLLNWKNDFRLGAGVGAFSVDMIFGMDAGWAVEGAVGSEYKIDATYLSPHVNMASRMMSACKQYGVSILLSQAVGELLSEIGKKKLRHLDTVTVKGSSIKQRIYTYDARHKGVDFFLHERTEDQADIDAEQYTSSIWETDPDLRAMRQHVTDDFVEKFNAGRREYLAGKWPSAIIYLKAADEIMVQNIIDQGYFDDELNDDNPEGIEVLEVNVRNEMGDGPSRRLISVMEQEEGIAPPDWKGYRPLTSK
mmetsp:Transcript_36058/g.53794  ORF Transcript_36058/g.53794 Transcript_36058/m.53794 type:complete len:1410 (-) Transcript_36058:375-4604(-)